MKHTNFNIFIFNILFICCQKTLVDKTVKLFNNEFSIPRLISKKNIIENLKSFNLENRRRLWAAKKIKKKFFSVDYYKFYKNTNITYSEISTSLSPGYSTTNTKSTITQDNITYDHVDQNITYQSSTLYPDIKKNILNEMLTSPWFLIVIITIIILIIFILFMVCKLKKNKLKKSVKNSKKRKHYKIVTYKV